MKRFRPVLLACILLAGCAPMQPASTTDPATFTMKPNEKYQTLVFGAGPLDALGPVSADLFGPAVRVNDTRCKPLLTWVRCELGPVLAGRFKTIFSTGVTSGRVEFGRGDGQRHQVQLR